MKKKTKKTINAKNKGSGYERTVAKWWRGKGFKKCETARYVSRKTDDLKIDLVETGVFSVQAKAQESGIYPHSVLDSMPKDSNYNLLFHKRNRKGTIVSMTLEDFGELLEMLLVNKIIKP
jgi:hypothetical protein